MLIPSGKVGVAIVWCLLITPLMQGIKQGDNLSDARESPTIRFLQISTIGKRGCSGILTLDFM